MNDQRDLEVMIASRFRFIASEPGGRPRVLQWLARIARARNLAL